MFSLENTSEGRIYRCLQLPNSVEKTEPRSSQKCSVVGQRQWTWEILIRFKKKYFQYEADHVLEEVYQRHCGISVLQGFQNFPGHIPELRGLSGPALSVRLD